MTEQNGTQLAKTEQKKATPIFGTMPTTDSIFNPFPPYALRNDCQAGQWKKGESDFKGSAIEISLIKAHKFYGELGKSRAHWLQLWFIPSPNEKKLPNNTVCVTYIKTRSLDDLSGKLIDLMTSEIDPGEVIFKASFEKHSGTLGTYYSVTWDYRDREGDAEQKQLDEIREFISTTPRLMDTGKPETLVCTDGMSQEELENLDETIDAIKDKQQEQAKLKGN